MAQPTTSERILDAAEKLFADNGFGATSLRAITAGAQVNLAAVHYHFGSKEALVQAVFERLLGPVNRERLRQLEVAEAEQDPPELTVILRAFFGPPIRLWEDHERGRVLVKLLGRLFADAEGLLEPVMRQQFAEVFQRFLSALRRALPTVREDDLVWRFHFFIGAGAHTVSHRQMIHGFCPGQAVGADSEELLEKLVEFGAAGFRATSRAMPEVR